MKKILIYFLVSIVQLVFTKSIAQCNLVPNSGFEFLTSCTTGTGSLQQGYAPPWDSPTNGSPDLFDTCITNLNYNVPVNLFGYQQTHSGNGYTNIISIYPFANGLREYIQVELDSALIINGEYCISFYANLSNLTGLGTNNIGMYFSSTHTFVNGNQYLSVTPQINYTSIISDTINWTEISGTYHALGGERYIIIGNFYPDSLTDTVAIPTSRPWNSRLAYYYIDDIDVHLCTCNVGVDEESESNKVAIYPNPSEGIFEIKSDKGKIQQVEIFNVLGEEIYVKEYNNKTSATININAPPGIYFVEVQAEKAIVRRKVVLQ